LFLEQHELTSRVENICLPFRQIFVPELGESIHKTFSSPNMVTGQNLGTLSYRIGVHGASKNFEPRSIRLWSMVTTYPPLDGLPCHIWSLMAIRYERTYGFQNFWRTGMPSSRIGLWWTP